MTSRSTLDLRTLGFALCDYSVGGADWEEQQNVVQRYFRAAELEMRATEEPLKSGLDVSGLKAEVLGRIEELEEREREREELMGAFVPAMEGRGYDPEALKAVMGG